MKIKINELSIENLKELQEEIKKVLEIDFQEMDATEENIKKVKEILESINAIGMSEFRYGKVCAKIISSDGTELTSI